MLEMVKKAKKPETSSAERMRDLRKRLKDEAEKEGPGKAATKAEAKKIPKSAAQRAKEYRDKKRDERERKSAPEKDD